MPGNIHRILVLFILLSVTIAACNATPALTATATLPIDTLTPPATATEAPTEIPSTPTETPDPNKPSDAVGGKDPVYGYFTKKAEDGVTTLYWIVNPENPKATGWFTNGVDTPYFHGGIPVIGNTGSQFYELMPMRFFIKDGISAPHLSHTDNTNTDGKPSFSGEFISLLRNRIQADTGTKPDFSEVWTDLYTNKNLSITVKDEKGVEHKMPIDNSVTVNIFLVDKEDFIPGPNSDFRDEKSKTTFEIAPDGTISVVNILVASKTKADIFSRDPVNMSALVLKPFFSLIGSSDKDIGKLVAWSSARNAPPHFKWELNNK